MTTATMSNGTAAGPRDTGELRRVALQILDKCVHFNGEQNPACKAGVCYADVKVRHDKLGPYGRTISLPCLKSRNVIGERACRCPKARFPSNDEARQMAVARLRELDLIGKGLSVCCEAPVDHRDTDTGRPQSRGTHRCSACRRLAYSV